MNRDTSGELMSGAVRNLLKSQRGDVSRQLSLAVGIGALGGFLLIIQAWFLARIVDAVIFHQASPNQVMPWAGAMAALFLVRSGLIFLSEQVSFDAAAIIRQNLRNRLFSHVQLLGPLYLSRESSGDIATVIIDGVEALEAYYARYLPAMSLAGLVPLSILAFVLPLDWQSALVLMLTAPLIPFFMILIGKGAERLNQKQWKQLARMGGHFLDVIQGLTTLKLFNASRREAQVIARISDDYRQATMKVLRVAFLSALALEFFATVSIAIVAVLIGFRLLFGELDFFVGFFILLLAPEFYLPLRSLGTHYHARMDAIGAAGRMVEILHTSPPESPSTAQSLLHGKLLRVDFHEVHFSYEEQRTALAGIEFSVRAGERVALVGPSGGGKSTVVNMLLGFIRPGKGNVRVNGLDLNRLDREQWRKRLAWVPQNPRLFHGSIRDNVCLGLSEVPEQAIWTAARAARADGFIRHLPEGLDTLVGEGRRGLSGGEVQRLALTRAFLRDAQLVILDEPTANLDRKSERYIQLAIDELAKHRTLIIVAHRLATVRKADRILVLDRGLIVEDGSHQRLLGAGGLYSSLINAQGSLA